MPELTINADEIASALRKHIETFSPSSSSTTATRRSAGRDRSLSAMRKSSLPSNVRANRKSSSSTSARWPSARATSSNALAYASIRGLSAIGQLLPTWLM